MLESQTSVFKEMKLWHTKRHNKVSGLRFENREKGVQKK